MAGRNTDVTNEGLYVGAVAGAQTFMVLGSVVGAMHKTIPKFQKFSPSVKVMVVTLPAVFVFALKMEQHVVDIALRRRVMGSPHTSTAAEHDKYRWS